MRQRLASRCSDFHLSFEFKHNLNWNVELDRVPKKQKNKNEEWIVAILYANFMSANIWAEISIHIGYIYIYKFLYASCGGRIKLQHSKTRIWMHNSLDNITDICVYWWLTQWWECEWRNGWITWLLLADIICLGRRRWIRFRAVW